MVTLADMIAILAEAAGVGGTDACATSVSVRVQGSDARDVNCDGFVDALDVLHVLLYMADLPQTPLPTGCAAVGDPLA